MIRKFSKRHLLAVAALLAGVGQASANTYTFKLFGLENGVRTHWFNSSSDINNVGQVLWSGHPVGESSVRPYLWSNGNLIDLSLGGSSTTGIALGLNNAGQVAGFSYPGYTGRQATVWDGNEATVLPGTGSEAEAISDTGLVVGSRAVGGGQWQATLWNGATSINLGALTERGNSDATAINHANQIAGISYTAEGDQRAVLWNGTAITDLGTLGGRASRANAINDAGIVVGLSETADGGSWAYHATMWKDGTLIDLSEGLNDTISTAEDINNLGQVVGSVRTANSPGHAVLWNGTTAIDLNSFLDASVVAEGWVLSGANGINDAGQIVGSAFNSNGSSLNGFVFLLTPSVVPEPSTWATILFGLTAMASVARRRHGPVSRPTSTTRFAPHTAA